MNNKNEVTKRSEKKFIRKKILINKKFQVGIIVKALFPVLFVIISAAGFGLWQIAYLRSEFHFNSFNEMIIKISPHMNKIANSSNTLFDFLYFTLIISAIAGFIIISVYVSIIFLYYSHRIVGPMYRFNQSFQNVLKGDLKSKINLREKDEFIHLAEKYNEMVENIRVKIKNIDENNLTIQKEIGKLSKAWEQKGQGNEAAINKIEELSKNIKNNTRSFQY